MRPHRILLALCLTIGAINSFAKFEAHEWGTFTSLVGSDGKTQHGMYHEDEKLPNFVHGFGATRPKQVIGNFAVNPGDPVNPTPPTTQPPRKPCRGKGCFDHDYFDSNIITQKMETPVIYFYSDVPRRVAINVQFPEGVITDTYPAPVKTFPTKKDSHVIAKGNTTFDVQILPTLTAPLPRVQKGNIYGHARAVNSNVIASGNEREKFIFYRGLGRFQPNLSIKSSNGDLRLLAGTTVIPQAAFLVHVDNQGRNVMLNLGAFVGGQQKVVNAYILNLMKSHVPHPSFITAGAARLALISSLVKAGLYADEATAMVNTWEHGYLKVPGLRLLYILPRSEVERNLPLRFLPAPEKLERVFVGRIEVLLDTDEERILSQIERSKHSFKVQSLGRFAEPILRRIHQVYLQRNEGKVDPVIDKLLKTFITQAANELR